MQARAIVDERGGVLVPARMWEALGVGPNDEVLVDLTEHGLVVRPLRCGQFESYTEERIVEFVGDDAAIEELLVKRRS